MRFSDERPYEEIEEYEAIEAEIPEEDPEPAQTEDKKSRSLLLTFLQTGVCIVIILGGVAVRLIGGTVHSTVATWFYDNYNDTVFTGAAEGLLPFADPVKFTETSTATPNMDTQADAEIISKLKRSMVQPLEGGNVTSPFGKRTDDSGKEQEHKGIDISSKKGTEIKAAFDGTVVTAEEDSSYGNYAVLSHQDGVRTLYAHCSKLLVKKGDKVKAGDKLALVGATGDADGDHLHFEVIVNGKNIDPAVIGTGDGSDHTESQA